MIQRTYGDVKDEIARVCGVSGMSVTDERLLVRTNSAIEELMNLGEWPNVVDRWHITALDGHIVLPTHLDRLMQINLRGVPQTVVSPWFQFVAYGPGTREDQQGFLRWWCDDSVITDRGESPVRVRLPETGGPWKLRVYTAVDESIVTDGTAANPDCTIQGNYGDEIIRTQVDGEWINGERVELDWTVPYVETVSDFDEVTVFTKPETNGYIKLTAWDGTTETELSNYLPTDTTPSYHHYFSQWLSELDAADDSPLRTVRARCRKRFVPAKEDTDVLIIGNVPALREMVVAQFKREADNAESYAPHMQSALAIMRAEALAYRGKSRIPGLTFQKGFAVGSNLPALR